MSPLSSRHGLPGLLHWIVVVVTTAILLHAAADTVDGQPRPAETRLASMAEIPAGRFTPQYDAGDGVHVDAFALDRTPVTVGQFLDFLAENPEWRRDRVKAVFADDGYLASLPADLDTKLEEETLREPVTEVSWFAARSYCAWRGARLPTTDEWEYAAAASETEADASGDPAFDRALLSLYGRRPSPDALPPVQHTFRNIHGVWDLHGLVWEWTADFNNQMVTGAGRDDRGLDRRLFCAAGSVGATDLKDYAGFLRYAHRASLTGDYTGRLLGFRCASSTDLR